jgi:AraC-like DNA-binding protein
LQLARAVGSSPFHLARAFKRTMGVTIHQHRLALRLHASLAMLRDTHDDISSIALDLGFGDHSHFTVAFRRRFGITPSRYRRGATFS